MTNIDNIIAKDLCAISIEIGREFDIDVSKIINIMDSYFIKNYDKNLKISNVFQIIKNAKNPTLKGQTKKINTPKKKSHDIPPKIKSDPSTPKCLFLDKKKGECCIVPKQGQIFCAKHVSTKFASNFMASLPDPDYKPPKSSPQIIRNKELKIWIVEDTNLVVESPTKKIVIGYVNKDKVSKKLTDKYKKMATDLGFGV